jgi:hypothetical protein
LDRLFEYFRSMPARDDGEKPEKEGEQEKEKEDAKKDA